MKPNSEQIKLYKRLREIAEPYHEYSDQMMAIAIYIDVEYKKRNNDKQERELNASNDTDNTNFKGAD